MHAHASLCADVPSVVVEKNDEFILIWSVRSVLNQTLLKY